MVVSDLLQNTWNELDCVLGVSIDLLKELIY